jgi:hypothetical protein
MRTSKVYFYSHAEEGMIIHASQYLRFALFFESEIPGCGCLFFLLFCFPVFLLVIFWEAGKRGSGLIVKKNISTYRLCLHASAKLGFYPCV